MSSQPEKFGESNCQFYTYVLTCVDGTLYTGWTTDVEKRLAVHNAGKGAKYTRCRLPVTLAKVWSFDTATEARQWEWQFKQYSRRKKLSLILA
jgi:putative endonuclease